jgi:hypothetical protein
MALTKALGGGGGSGITELTGDVTAGPGSGAQAATLANGSVDIAHHSATGTPSATTYLRGDNTWSTPTGGTPAEERIDRQTPSGTGTVTFSSLGSYSDLRIVVTGRGSVAAVAASVFVRLNNDSGNNYDYETVETNGTTNTAAGTLASSRWHMGYIAGSTAPSNVGDACECRIYDYRGTTFQKTMLAVSNAKVGTGSGNDLYHTRLSGFWRNTAAVTQVDVILSSGNFDSGSVVSLYGIL